MVTNCDVSSKDMVARSFKSAPAENTLGANDEHNTTHRGEPVVVAASSLPEHSSSLKTFNNCSSIDRPMALAGGRLILSNAIEVDGTSSRRKCSRIMCCSAVSSLPDCEWKNCALQNCCTQTVRWCDSGEHASWNEEEMKCIYRIEENMILADLRILISEPIFSKQVTT